MTALCCRAPGFRGKEVLSTKRRVAPQHGSGHKQQAVQGRSSLLNRTAQGLLQVCVVFVVLRAVASCGAAAEGSAAPASAASSTEQMAGSSPRVRHRAP